MATTTSSSIPNDSDAEISLSSCRRASARAKVADSWADRRKSSNSNKQSLHKQQRQDKSSNSENKDDSIPVCQVVRNAWGQLALDVSRRLQSRHKKSRTPNTMEPTPRVFPSVVSVLQANAVSNQVVGVFQQDKTTLMNILPADYNFQKAIQSMASSRQRAFLLLDLSAVVNRKVELNKSFKGVQLQYSVQHNRDVKLLELCCRLGIGLRTNSNMDVQAAMDAQQQQGMTTNLIFDDAGATRKPNGYLRRIMKLQHSCSLAVDGPEEVQRICATFHRLQSRLDFDGRGELTFTLRLPRDLQQWESLVQCTRKACCETDTRLLGVSIELLEKDEYYLQEIRQTIATLFVDDTINIDVTGAVSQDVAPFLTHLASFHRVTVDASSLLVEHAGALCTRIIGVKQETEDEQHLFIDDGCYGTLYRDWNTSNDQQQETTVPLPLLNTQSLETQLTTVWGPTCDGLDCVCRGAVLPKMKVDEWLVFPDMGLASGMGTAFNGFDPPDVAYCVLGYFREL